MASNATYKHCVNFTYKAYGKWERGKPLKTVIHGLNIIENLIDIGWAPGIVQFCLSFQDVIKRRLRALNLAGEYRFLSDIHKDEEVRVGQSLN